MRRGVIDIGTNSIKLLIADLSEGGGISPRLETSRQTRLGQGLYTAGKLQSDPIRATVAAVNELFALAKRNDCGDTRIIATSAVREAANSGELLDALAQAVDVLSGDDEARLAFAGAVSCPRLANDPALVLDVGGGSTEFIVGDAGGMRFYMSLPLGSVRLMERHPVSDPPATGELQTVRKSIDTQLRARVVPELRCQIAALGQAAFGSVAGHRRRGQHPCNDGAGYRRPRPRADRGGRVVPRSGGGLARVAVGVAPGQAPGNHRPAGQSSRRGAVRQPDRRAINEPARLRRPAGQHPGHSVWCAVLLSVQQKRLAKRSARPYTGARHCPVV